MRGRDAVLFSGPKRWYWRRRTLGSNVKVGTDFTFGTHSYLWAPRSLVIGNDVGIGSRVRIEVDGTIGHGVLIANGTAVVGRTDHALGEIGRLIRRARWVGTDPSELSHPVHIGSDVWIGYGAIILSGVTIGESAVIGAGAVVTKDVAPNSIVVGNPAREVSRRFSAEDFIEHWDVLSSRGVGRFL